MNRRQFVKAGLFGGAALAAGGAWIAWTDAQRNDPANRVANERSAQDRIDRIVGAIAPVLLAGALPDDPARRASALARVTQDVGDVVAIFTPPVRKEVHELFNLLDIGVTRLLLTGICAGWADAQPGDIRAFLERWRHSRFEMLRSAYHALHDLVFGAWYASDETWAGLGYAGPPEIA